MKIGVISDIHDNIFNLLKSFEILTKEKVSKVFFCGDLNSPFAIDYFTKLALPVMAVFGNNEGDRISIKRRIEVNQLKNFQYPSTQGLMWDLKLANKRIGAYHGFQQEILEGLVNSNLFDVFLSGHSHLAAIKTIGKTLWVNPGCICGWVGLDVRPVEPTLAVLDLSMNRAQIIKI